MKRDARFFLVLFLLVLLVAGGALFSLNPRFTGFVTNVDNGSSINSFEFSNGSFQSTKFDSSENAVVLNNASSGSYTSQFFDSGQDSVWDNLVYVSDIPQNSTLVFYARSCDDSVCDNESFNAITPPTLNLNGRYLQYKVDMTALTNSPKLYEVNLSYSPVVQQVSLPLNIESPQSMTYTSESVLVKISTSALNTTIWFYNGTGNETYTGEVYRTFANGGQYTLYAWISDSNGNQNSSSVAFSVSVPSQSSCTPDWDCENWGKCESGTKIRECTDLNSCGTDDGKPELTLTCVTEEVTSEDESSVQIPVTSSESASCSSGWVCSDWSECVDNSQARECSDANSCGTEEGKPSVTQECQPAESCTDGIKNQDESGVDCGGEICENRCSVFTIVGGAVREGGFATKAGAVIVFLVLIAVAGFVGFRFYLGKREFSDFVEGKVYEFKSLLNKFRLFGKPLRL
ncbi:MAG TPA: hypothetical protein VJ208_01235 [Candidatus Nanoarchaeia archaeon]|nr:hypothetical protein [Candidatus Nanoarchaeia archaeon]